MKAYFISGLGADEKIFRHIKLPQGFEKMYIHWLEPMNDESFENYARRLSQPIQQNENYILIGLSLGGMMAIEMNKFLYPKYTVLISSAVNNNYLPRWTKLFSKTGIHKIVPEKIFRSNNFYSKKNLGIQSEEDKALLNEMLPNASINLFRWAIPKIIQWNNKFIPKNLLRIHGTSDRIIPFPKNENVVPILNGTHFMCFNRAAEINKIFEENLSSLTLKY